MCHKDKPRQKIDNPIIMKMKPIVETIRCDRITFLPLLVWILTIHLGLLVNSVQGAISGYKEQPTQYHIQTDEGKDRFFRFQTYNGQYRKERRLDDGTVIGSYGWVDPTGMLRMTDYIADSKGYRVLKNSMHFVGTNSILPEAFKPHRQHKVLLSSAPTNKKIGSKVALPSGKLPFKVIVKKRLPTTSAIQQPTRSPLLLPESKSQPVLIVYGPLRSANVHSGKVVIRRRRPQGGVEQEDEIPSSDVFLKYTEGFPPSSSRKGSFIYRIPGQFHKEQSEGNGEKQGAFGYVDPFGIRRVIHYNATKNEGFQAVRDFKFVGVKNQEEEIDGVNHH